MGEYHFRRYDGARVRAGGLWNWKLFPDEKGWPDWANTKAAWYDSIEFEGSKYVGYVSKALDSLDITDIERRHDLADGKLALAKPGKIYIVYLPEGGDVMLNELDDSLPYRWFNPKTGEWDQNGVVEAGKVLKSPDSEPWVLIAAEHEF